MRAFYCPTHGKIVDHQDGEEPPPSVNAGCAQCSTWFYGLRRKTAKRSGES